MKDIQIEIHNNCDYVYLADFYQWNLNKLEDNSFTLAEQAQALEAMKSIDYLRNIMEDKLIAKGIMIKTIEGLRAKTIPCDIYAISYIYWQCNQYGFDTQVLGESIGVNSEWIANKYMENCNKS